MSYENYSFDEAFALWFEGAKKIRDDYMSDNFPKNPREELVYKSGRRYVKIIRRPVDGGGGSVYAFIDKSNGDVLKPASYSAPAKGARGNIFDESNGLRKVGPYGPAYLK